MSEGIKVNSISKHLLAALQQHIDVISVEDALSIVDSYGQTGSDVNEMFQIQMVLRDKVREQELYIASLHDQLGSLRSQYDNCHAELTEIHEIAACGWANVMQHPVTPEDTMTVRSVKIMAEELRKRRPAELAKSVPLPNADNLNPTAPPQGAGE